MMALLGMQEEANQYHNDENEIEGHLLDEICPNPDEMTYEELLALQEKIGYVSKGLTQEQINVRVFINLENSNDKLFEEGEKSINKQT